MSNEHLSRNPYQLACREEHKSAWCYEEAGGLKVVTEFHQEHGQTQYITATIPWKKVRAALKRKDGEA